MKKTLFLIVSCDLGLVPCVFSQNVGIGTATPAFKLDVSGESINTDSVYRIGGNKVLSVKLQNTFLGIGAANSITTGNHNTANGHQSLYSNTTGNENTANGEKSLYANTTGSFKPGLFTVCSAAGKSCAGAQVRKRETFKTH